MQGTSYGESFGSIDTNTWSVERLFKGKQREDKASQSYSSLAWARDALWVIEFDGKVWRLPFES